MQRLCSSPSWPSLTLPWGTVLAQPGFYLHEESETVLRLREDRLNHHFREITLLRGKAKCIYHIHISHLLSFSFPLNGVTFLLLPSYFRREATVCLPHEVPSTWSLVSPESKSSYKALDDWGCESGGIGQGDLTQGRKKGQYKGASPCWPLLQATGTPSHWDLLESVMKCLSQLPIWVMKVESSYPSSSSPLGSRVAPLVLSPSYFQVAHAGVQTFQGNLMWRQQRSLKCQKQTEKGMGQIKCCQFPRVQTRSTGPVWVGCLPMKCSRTLHRSSRLVGNWQGRTKIFLNSPFGSVTMFTWGLFYQARVTGIHCPTWLVGYPVQPLCKDGGGRGEYR